MATMRMRFQRAELSWIALLLSGMLVGAILVVGINSLRQTTARTVAPAVVAPPAVVSEVPGGRLGGLASADSANDWLVREGLSRAASLQVAEPMVTGGRLGGAESADTVNDWLVRQGLSEPTVIGGRLGGIESSDTANDATVKRTSPRIVGPGESLNPVQ